jgi:DNA primase
MNIPHLHPDTVDAVKQRADIVDIVSESVVLRKRGKDYVGLCPFHDDKSPSFTVSPSKQFYYCFSCGAGGNGIKFLMELGKQSFADVVLDLAKRYQVPVKTLEPEQRQELQRQLSLREQLYEILAIAAKFYEHALYQAQGIKALEYLTDIRQFQPDTIRQFQLGYAPGGWQTLYHYLVEQKRYPVELVERAGLIVPRDAGRGYYDRFRDRLIIPIHDIQSRVIGFGGRAFGDEQPKYLNSPETELFEKGKNLFGLDKARAAIAKQDQAIVVEGYFDAIALHAAGMTNAVASLGTALSLSQVKLLLRYSESKQIIFNFDADAAGVKAAERAIGEVADLAYKGEVQLRILNIPDGKDPDEYLKQHSSEEYQTLVQTAPLWLDWQLQKAFGGRDLEQADHYHQVTQDVVQLLSNIANASTRTHYVRHSAELLSRGDGRLVPLLAETLLAQVKRQRRRSPDGQEMPRSVQPLPNATDFLEQAEISLLRIYLHCPEHRQQVTDELERRALDFCLAHHRFLWQQVQELNPTTDFEQDDLAQQVRDRAAEFPEQMGRVSHILHLEEKTELDILRANLVIRTAADCLERVMCDKRYRYFSDLMKQTDVVNAPDLGLHYQQQMYAEKRRMAELDRQRSVNLADLSLLPS